MAVFQPKEADPARLSLARTNPRLSLASAWARPRLRSKPRKAPFEAENAIAASYDVGADEPRKFLSPLLSPVIAFRLAPL